MHSVVHLAQVLKSLEVAYQVTSHSDGTWSCIVMDDKGMPVVEFSKKAIWHPVRVEKPV